MGRGSVFLADDDVVVNANKLKKLERAAAAPGGPDNATLEQYKAANEGLAAENQQLRQQLAALQP